MARGLARAIASAIRSSVRAGYYPNAIEQFINCCDSPLAQRLAGHALVHSMWRLGTKRPAHVQRNFYFLFEVVHAGVRIHPRTLAVHFNELLRLAPDAPSASSNTAHPSHTELIRLNPGHVRNKVLRTAVYLFVRARETFHFRTQDVFMSLITSLLEQKEHLAATLLFDKVAQDRALLLALPSAVEQAKASVSPDYESLKKRLDYLEAENLVPDLASLTLITDHLLAQMQRPFEVGNEDFFCCVQSAVVLAALLDRGQLPEGGGPIVISLLRAFIRSQSNNVYDRCKIYRVHIDVEPKPITVNAILYAHQILLAYLAAQTKTIQPDPPSTEASQDTTVDASEGTMGTEASEDTTVKASDGIMVEASEDTTAEASDDTTVEALEDTMVDASEDMTIQWQKGSFSELELLSPFRTLFVARMREYA
ncbi:hypothetical protein C0993_000594 [Termitomyces sp. T159_Od127]|nr:hypothetical protein C0993_000594 [Termitomyces sp. T159_Od127]